MDQVAISEERYMDLIRKEESYFNIMLTLEKSRTEVKAFGDSKSVAKASHYELSANVLDEHREIFMKNIGGK